MSKTNVIMNPPKYIIKKDKGIIICKIYTISDITLYKNIDYNQIDSKLKKLFSHKFEDTIVFTAVAKCSKHDEYNELIGKRIAESKCKRKIYNHYLKVYQQLYNMLIQDINIISYNINNLYNCLQKEEQHSKDLMQYED